MARIFLSYRRDDSAGYTGRIFDHLSNRFGASRVFMDVEGIDFGENFAKAIEASIAQCDTVVAVIGRQWAGSADISAGRRIDDPADYVRQEIAATLRLGVELVPVLVGGAKFPSKQELPPDLVDMSFRNALQIDDSAFLVGVDRLIAVLERTTALSAERKRLAVSGRKKPGDSNWGKNLRRLLLFYVPAHPATWILHVLFYVVLFFVIVLCLVAAFEPALGIGAGLAMVGMYIGILALLRAIATIIEPDQTTSQIRRWFLLYKPSRASIALVHALFFLMIAGSIFPAFLLIVGHAGPVSFLVIWIIATFLVREVAAARDPLRKKDAESNWFFRMMYLWRPRRAGTWIPRILFYLSGLGLLILLPRAFAAEDGTLNLPSILGNRSVLATASFYLALAMSARGWAKSKEVLRYQAGAGRLRGKIWRMLMLYRPSQNVELVPQLLFWFSLALLVGLLTRRGLTLSLLGGAGTNWVHLSILAALLALSAQQWAKLYEQRSQP